MGETPDQLRAEIDGTRADMTATVNAITDRTDPRKVVGRRVDRIGRSFGSVRDAVMGQAEQLTDATRGIGDRIGSGPDQARQQTRGNPLAAGLVAFGGGLLLASVLPASRAEQRLAGELVDQAEPVVDHAKQAAQQVAGALRSSAEDAAAQVKETAAGGVQRVRDEATDAAGDVGEAGRSASGEVRRAAGR